MDAGKLVKWIVVIAIVFVAWKYGLPWVKEKTSHTGATQASASDSPCISIADRAAETWGSGIGKFANPPYDLNAWSAFSASVNSQIVATETACGCASESCTKAQGAMHDLKGLVSDLDSSIRSSQPPSGDIVQRQAAIDAQLDTARDLVRAGK
jgi:hypothetical protein